MGHNRSNKPPTTVLGPTNWSSRKRKKMERKNRKEDVFRARRERITGLRRIVAIGLQIAIWVIDLKLSLHEGNQNFHLMLGTFQFLKPYECVVCGKMGWGWPRTHFTGGSELCLSLKCRLKLSLR